MSTRDAYKQKMEAELEAAQAKLAELKARAKSAGADAQLEASRRMDELEKGVESAKAKLKELGESSEEAWEKLKDGIDNAWSALSTSVRDAAAKFKD